MAVARARNDLGQYDDLAGAWWDRRGKFAMLHWIATARAALIEPARAPDALLVDFACGGGLMAPHAARLGYRHVGVDITTSALHQARNHAVLAVRADVNAVPLRDACADVVTVGEILEHVSQPQVVLAEAVRVLRPGGQLVIDTIAATRRARILAVEIAERIPGIAPRGIHDPALFVDPRTVMRTCARLGVPLSVRGMRLDLRSAALWLLGRRDMARLVPSGSTAVLYQAWGRRVVRDDRRTA